MADLRRWVHYVPSWAEAVDRKTEGVFTQVFGFIDVLIQRIAKISKVLVAGGPLDPQRYFYCGYKGYHALKWQGIESPCGITLYFGQPSMGSVSDSTIMLVPLSILFIYKHVHGPLMSFWYRYNSGVLGDLQAVATYYNYQFGVYGDPAYPGSPVMYKPYVSGGYISAAQRVHNHRGARARVTVEWKFGDVQQYWRATTEWKQMRLLAMPVTRYMLAAAFLTNCVNCHHPNRTEKYFDCAPPSLPAYFRVMQQPYQQNLDHYIYV
jgi:hypothetical protein